MSSLTSISSRSQFGIRTPNMDWYNSEQNNICWSYKETWIQSSSVQKDSIKQTSARSKLQYPVTIPWDTTPPLLLVLSVGLDTAYFATSAAIWTLRDSRILRLFDSSQGICSGCIEAVYSNSRREKVGLALSSTICLIYHSLLRLIFTEESPSTDRRLSDYRQHHPIVIQSSILEF
jgi:hypothetical protein